MSEIVITPTPEIAVGLTPAPEIDVEVAVATPNQVDVTVAYQPASDNLSLLAEVDSSDLGRQLLSAEDAATVRELLEIDDEESAPIAMTDVTGLQPALDQLTTATHQNTSSISALSTTVQGKANATHGHTISDIANLTTFLNNKAEEEAMMLSDQILSDRLDVVEAALPNKANNNHTHFFSEVIESATDTPLSEYLDNLADDIDGKANAVHLHEMSNVTGLADALNSKASSSHSHTFGQYQIIYGWANIAQSVSSTLSDLQAIDSTTNNLKLEGFTYNAANRELITPAGGLYLIGISGRLNDFSNVTSTRLSILINGNESLRSINTYSAVRMTAISPNVPIRFQISCDQARTFNGSMFVIRIA